MLSIMFKNGGARLFIEKDLTAEVLAENIAKLIQNPELLLGMEKAMRDRAFPTAAEHIVDECLALLNRKPKTKQS